MKFSSKIFNWGNAISWTPPGGVTKVYMQPIPHPQTRLWDCGSQHMMAYALLGRGNIPNLRYIPVGWGLNTSGQIGDGTLTNRLMPTPISGVATNYAQKDLMKLECAVDNSIFGRAPNALFYSTGPAPTYNNLDGTLTTRNSATIMNIGSGTLVFRKGSNGAGYILDAAGNLNAWGDNSNGQIGDNTITTRSSTTVVSGGGLYEQVFPVPYGCFAKRLTGEMYCWGRNEAGQLGINNIVEQHVPVLFSAANANKWKKIVGAPDVTAGLKTDGTVWLWGATTNGMITPASAVASLVPVQIPGISGIIDIESNNYNTMLLKVDGTILGWGPNANGQLGGIGLNITTPTVVASNPLTIQMGLGTNFGAYLTSDGNIWTSGNNTNGQLADNTTTSRNAFAVAARQVTIGAGTFNVRYVRDIYRPAQPLPIPVTPGSPITVNTNGTIDTGGAGTRIYNFASLDGSAGVKIFWFE
jgi:alpha-tubulin suppressor-like RCC1 family protein